MDDIIIRPVTSEEYPAFSTAFVEGFSEDLPDKAFPEHIERLLPPERTLAAFDGGAIVGTFGGFDLQLTVPGGTVPMEGTTVVTVFPTHRRMGLMDSMMADHLETAAHNGYPIAGLWASGSGIYGRHGYGVASYAASRAIDGPRFELRKGIPVDRVHRVTADQASGVLPNAFDPVCASTPGMYARTETWWSENILRDEEWMKRGKTSQRIVVHDGPDGVDGYLIYRQKSRESDDGHANGEVSVTEMTAATPRALASLWSYVTRVDGCPKVTLWNMPVGADIFSMMSEQRKLRTTALFDALWIRILDVPTALAARRYEEDGIVVFAVGDPFRPGTAGTYRLAVSEGAASCARTDVEPDVEMDIDVLGSLYLGGANAMAYRSAGRIRGPEADVIGLHRLFRTLRAPWCNEVF